MKKLFAVLFVSVCMIACCAMSVYAAETTNLLSEEYLTLPSGGAWEWVDGKLAASNKDTGDTAIMSDVFVDVGEHVVLEATGTIVDGQAWGIMLGLIDPSAPFASWNCINIDLNRLDSRLFGPGVANPDEAKVLNTNLTTGQPYTLALEITEDNMFKCYFNGELYGERQNDEWIGAYVGLMTFFSNTDFTSYSITRLGSGEKYEPEKIEMVIVEKPHDERTLTLGETTDLLAEENFKAVVNGEYNWVDGKLVAPNAALGDTANMTDYFVEPDDHVYIEVTGNVTEGQAFGIMMARNSYENPFESWNCMNMEIGRPSTRAFGPGLAKEVQLYSTDFTNNKPLTIGLEIDNGMFYLYSEGKLFGQIENTEWIGCWLGLMTWTGSVEFTSFKVSEVVGAEQYTVYPDGTKELVASTGTTEAPETEAPVVETEAPVVETEAPETEAEVVETEAPETEAEVVETAAPETEAEVVETPAAPQTFDFGVIAVIAAVVSAAGFAVSKKRN